MLRIPSPALVLATVLPIHAGDRISVTEYHTPAATTASSAFDTMQAAANLTNGSGLDGPRHDRDGSARTMWHTVENPGSTPPAPGLAPAPAWVRFDFRHPVDLSSVLIWNHNQAGLTDRGFRNIRIYASADGKSWTPLASAGLKPGGDTPQTIAVTPGQPPVAILIAADSNHGGGCYGLSEVKFASVRGIPAGAAPFPDSMECRPESVYRHRPDGNPGRGVTLGFSGAPLFGAGSVEIAVAGGRHTLVDAAPGRTRAARRLRGGVAECPDGFGAHLVLLGSPPAAAHP